LSVMMKLIRRWLRPLGSAAALAVLATGSASAADPIAQYRWNNRVLVILAPGAGDEAFGTQKNAYERARAEYHERDLVVLAEPDGTGPLHRKFHVPAGEFRVLLIGKDGHTALERSQPVTNQDLLGLIDVMPMRRQEMRSKGS
jgi:Domain of unknown function (DUF4174)